MHASRYGLVLSALTLMLLSGCAAALDAGREKGGALYNGDAMERGADGSAYAMKLDEAPPIPEPAPVPESSDELREPGVILYGAIGFTSPVIQIPLLGNHLALGLGYRVRYDIELFAMYEHQGCTDLVDYSGGDAHPTTFECNMTTSTFAAEARCYPINWFYASLSAGWMSVNASIVNHGGSNERYPGFSDGAAAVAIGIGARPWDFLTIEYRRQFGLGRIQVDSTTSGALSFGTLRIGGNITF